MAHQPWKLLSILWPLLCAAIIPVTLTTVVRRLDLLAQNLNASDSRAEHKKQLGVLRLRFEQRGQLLLAAAG
jgi:hypothetical protein